VRDCTALRPWQYLYRRGPGIALLATRYHPRSDCSRTSPPYAVSPMKSLLFLSAMVVSLVSCATDLPTNSNIAGWQAAFDLPRHSGYTVLDLGLLPGAGASNGSLARVINNWGLIGGLAYDANNGQRPVLWTPNGAIIDIGGSQFPSGATVTDVNDLGQALVTSLSGQDGSLWSPLAGLRPIPAVVGTPEFYALSLNDRGDILGYPPSGPYSVWNPRDGLRRVPTLEGGTAVVGSPGTLNNRGDVAGAIVWPIDDSHSQQRAAIFWHTGTAVDLGLPTGSGSSRADAINDRGEVAGVVTLSSYEPFIWSERAGMRVIGHPPGGRKTIVTGLNDGGDLAGASNIGAGWTGFEWSARGGFVLLPPLPGDVFTWAEDLNDFGDVVGYSWGNPQRVGFHAVLWRNNEQRLD
jgi:hypothetical protein